MFGRKTKKLQKRANWAVKAFTLSLALNVGFAALFYIFFLKEREVYRYLSYRPSEVEEGTLPLTSSLLDKLRALSIDDLLSMLHDTKPYKEGILVRDIALTALYSLHHIDVEKALGKQVIRREGKIGEVMLSIFPYLDDEDFMSVAAFVREEHFPYTTEGLFMRLKEAPEHRELAEKFLSTEPMILMRTLFARAQEAVLSTDLMRMVLEGDFERLNAFYLEQREGASFTDRKRRQVLLSYLMEGSRGAAYLLAITDAVFVMQELEEGGVTRLLSLLDQGSEKVDAFLLPLMQQSRSSKVAKLAVKKYALLHNVPEKEITAKFYNRPGGGELRPSFRQKPPPSLPPEIHVVQPGESLWLIAKKYEIDIETLMELNHLSSTTIKPGLMLNIQSRGS